MKVLVFALPCLVSTMAFGRTPAPVLPARPFAEAAADFYPEVGKQYEFYRRWAARADGSEADSCRAQYHRAIREAFGAYRTASRRELAQTRWPLTLELRCTGSGARTCTQDYTAPTGQEWDTTGLRTQGRPLDARPALSPDRRHLTAALSKRG